MIMYFYRGPALPFRNGMGMYKRGTRFHLSQILSQVSTWKTFLPPPPYIITVAIKEYTNVSFFMDLWHEITKFMPWFSLHQQLWLKVAHVLFQICYCFVPYTPGCNCNICTPSLLLHIKWQITASANAQPVRPIIQSHHKRPYIYLVNLRQMQLWYWQIALFSQTNFAKLHVQWNQTTDQ